MLEFHAHDFYVLTGQLTRLSGWVEAKQDEEGSAFHAERPLDERDRLLVGEAVGKLPISSTPSVPRWLQWHLTKWD
jgi:hypothetical protein